MFHNTLRSNSLNKIIADIQAVCTKSQLFASAEDLCSGITVSKLDNGGALVMIFGQIHKHDALMVVSEACKAFNTLLNTRSGTSKSMKNF